jgi:CBS domain-containing protein
MSISVKDVMVRDVVTVDSEYSVKYAAKVMSYFNIGSIIALSEGNVVGILTERDVMTRVVAAGMDPEKVMVCEAMSKPVIVTGPTMPIEDAVKIMFKKRIKKLPVIIKEKDRSKLVGLLSITDVARLQPQMLETMRELSTMGSQETKELVGFYVR